MVKYINIRQFKKCLLEFKVIYYLFFSLSFLSLRSQSITDVCSVIKKIEITGNGTLILFENGELWSVGNNNYGELGIGNTINQRKFMLVGTGFTDVFSEDGYVVALKGSELWGWGHNVNGTLGIGNTTNQTRPVKITDNVVKVGLGWFKLYVLKSNGQLYAAGENASGNFLGIGNNNSTKIVNLTIVGSDFTDVVAVGKATYGLKKDALYSWGDNSYGRLGLGNTTHMNAPQFVGNGFEKVFSVIGTLSAFAIKNGELYAWGWNAYGQLGLGNTTDRSSPVSLGKGYTDVKNVTTTVLALKNGELYAWGGNDVGQLGDGTTTNRTTPIRVSSVGSVKEFKFMNKGVIVLNNNSDVFTWGQNALGQLGVVVSSHQRTPIKVGSGYTRIYAGRWGAVFALKGTDLYVWGSNNYGYLGIGTASSQLTPLLLSKGVVNFNISVINPVCNQDLSKLEINDIVGVSIGSDVLEYRKIGSSTWISQKITSKDMVIYLQSEGKHEVRVKTSVIVGCANGNEKTEIIDVIKPNAISFRVSFEKSTKASGNGKIYIYSISGGTGIKKISYSNNNGVTWIGERVLSNIKDSIINLQGGKYKVKIIDDNGCSRIEDIEVLSCLEIGIDFIVKNSSLSSKPDAEISAIIRGSQNKPYTYEWFRENENSNYDRITYGTEKDSVLNLKNILAGKYRIMLTDLNGCTFMKDTLVKSEICENININYTLLEPIKEDAGNGEIYLTVEGGVMPYMYKWTALTQGNKVSEYSKDQIGINPGWYKVEVTDYMGCKNILDSIELRSTDGKCGTLYAELTRDNVLVVKINDMDRSSYHDYILKDEKGDEIFSLLEKKEIERKIFSMGKYRLYVKERSIYGCNYEIEVGTGISLGPMLVGKENELSFKINKDIYRINLKILSMRGNVIFEDDDYSNEVLHKEMSSGTYYYFIRLHDREKDDIVLEYQSYIEKVD